MYLCWVKSAFPFILYLWIQIHGPKWMRIPPDPHQCFLVLSRIQKPKINKNFLFQFHSTRLPVILKTWFNLAPKQTFFFTGKLYLRLFETERSLYFITGIYFMLWYGGGGRDLGKKWKRERKMEESYIKNGIKALKMRLGLPNRMFFYSLKSEKCFTIYFFQTFCNCTCYVMAYFCCLIS